MKNSLITLFIMILSLQGCKPPMNAINFDSVPEEYDVENCTNPIFKEVYDEINETIDTYLFESDKDSVYHSFFVIFIDDTIEDIMSYSRKKNICLISKNSLYPEIQIDVDTSCLELREMISFYKKSCDRNLSKDHKKGHSFEKIQEKYHNTLFEYFNINYSLFIQDTMKNWNKNNYTNKFEKGSGQIADVFKHIILYYNFFPDKMVDWSNTEKQNMRFLIQNYGKSNEELSEEIETWVDKNKMVNVTLLTLLQYIQTENPDQYRFVQNKCYNNPQLQWFNVSN